MRHLTLLFILLFCFGAVSAGPISTTIDVAFTHAGDDGSLGTASLLEFYWTADTTSGWTMITDTITPMEGLTVDTAYLAIVFPDNGSYWIGARATDEAGNASTVCVFGRVDLPDVTGPSCITGTIIKVTRE